MIPKLSQPLRLHHLPLLMDVLRRIKLLDVIDATVRDDPRSKVSTSDCVAVMLSAIYIGAHDLYGVRERLERYDMQTIMRDPGFSIHDFPEERLAKAMDDLWETGPEKLMFAIAAQVIAAFKLDTRYFRFDTTSLTCFGAYENEDDLLSGDGELPPWITYGHSKDHRGDLKQILYGMMLTGDGGIPVFGEVIDGNSSDTAAAAAFFGRVRQLVADPRDVVCVADCKSWSGNVLTMIQREKMRLLSRLPRNHKVHGEIMAKPWKPEGTLAIPNHRRRSAPAERYEYMGFDVDCPFTIIHPEADGQPEKKERITVPARAVRVYSSALHKRKIKTLARIRKRDERNAKTFIREAQKRAYACEEDAKRAAERDEIAQRRTTLNVTTTLSHHSGKYARGRGRPSKKAEPGIKQPHWRISYAITPVADDVATKRLEMSATFVIIRTRNDGWTLSDRDMISRYKGQYYNEHGFSWLKSGAAMNPIFLKTPHRVAALGFIYCIGLMVWSLIQRSVRAYLGEHHRTLPYHRGRRGKTITTRFIFELFQNVLSQRVTMPDGAVHHVVHGLSAHAARACRGLGTQLRVFRHVA
jgi:transposase